MDVEKVFHMKEGVGDTSYYKNSSVQKSVGEKMKDITLEAMEETYTALRPESVGIADLGCSSGFNTLRYIKMLVGGVEGVSQELRQASPEFRVCLNDLPTNDFNTIFQALPNLKEELKKGRSNDEAPSSVFVAAYPGSFYHRLFPNNSLHFAFSFSSLHWLSRIPIGIYDDERGRSLNKSSIYITRNSPSQVWEAYAKQFEDDFAMFLEARSAEVVSGGRMVLVMAGRNSSDYFSLDNTLFWEVLHQAFLTLVTKGRIEEEKLESYDVHYYEPCKQEIQHIVSKQSSFELERLQIERDVISSNSVAIAKTVRAVQESMISLHFGEGILDELFAEYGRLLEIEMPTKMINVNYVVAVLRKL